MNIQGIIPALITPFDEKEQIDYTALRRLINHLIEEGADGFYVGGSTSECFLLTAEERREVLRVAVEETAGRVPIIAHVGEMSTAKAAALAEYAAQLGVDAVSSVPPFYYKYSLAELTQYYNDLCSATDRPMIVYSIPAMSGVAFTAENLGPILENPQVQGLKYTSYDLFELEKIHRRYPALKVFNGHDELLANALPIGITGAIGSTFNIMARSYKAICAAYAQGDVKTVSELQHRVNTVTEGLIRTDVIRSIKYILTKKGIPCGNSRRPFAPLTEQDKTFLDDLYEQYF